MDGEKKINLEGVPLNSSGAANIYLNTGKNTKVNSPNGTIIQLNTEKSNAADLGLHINTTFSIASSKKIKLLFILNILLSILCMVISCSVVFYYWTEISNVRRQVDTLKDQFIILNVRGPDLQDKIQAGALTSIRRSEARIAEREPRMHITKDNLLINRRIFYVENLGEDMLLVDSRKKNIAEEKPSPEVPKDTPKGEGMVVAHFNGDRHEINLGNNAIIGPWVRDVEVSSKNSELKVELTDMQYVTIRETGLYLVYAQVVYLSQAPNCYFIWARQTTQKPRLLASCSTGNDSSNRPLSNSQISCATHTVARLNKGDIVNLAQREHNRTLWLRPGYTYMGFIKLGS